MGLRTDLRTLFARLASICCDDDKHTQPRPRMIIGSPYDFKHVSGASSVSSSPSDSSSSSSPTSSYSSDTFSSSIGSEKSDTPNTFTSSTRSERSITISDKSDPIPIPIPVPSIKRKDVAGCRIPTNTGIEAFLASRRMGLESGKGDGKGRNITPESLDVVAVNEDEGVVSDAQMAEQREETAAASDDGNLASSIPTAANTDTSDVTDVGHASGFIDPQSPAGKAEPENDDDDENRSANEYDNEEEYEEYEGDDGEDDTDDEHNGILLLLDEDESEVVTATAVSMKRYGSTDLPSESINEDE